MTEYGLIGRTLGHSFSKDYFNGFFKKEGIDAAYNNYELETAGQLTELINTNRQLAGLNVTIPYKQQIIPYLDDLSEEAAAVNAVNAVIVKRIGDRIQTKGYNTDIEGFRHSLEGIKIPEKAMILGTGGAAAAIKYVLQQKGCSLTIVSRNPEKGLPYSELTPAIIAVHKLIVNCTPLGTYPNINEKPDIPYDGISDEHFLYDLVYNPSETSFLKEGIKRGAKIQNGLRMLHGQAEAFWELTCDV